MRVSHFNEIDENVVVNVTMKIMKVIIIFGGGGGGGGGGGRGKTIVQVRKAWHNYCSGGWGEGG